MARLRRAVCLLGLTPLLCAAEKAAVFQQPDGSLTLTAGASTNPAVAWASFEDGLNTTGWGLLDVQTSGLFNDTLQHRAAGILEGFLTAKHISSAAVNAVDYVFQNNVSQPSIAFLREQVAWAQAQVAANPSDLFWQHVGAIMAQLEGLREGHGLAADQKLVGKLPDWSFLLLNGVGDLFQIMPAVDHSRRANFAAMTSKELQQYVIEKGMCSALIKVPGEFEDLFMAHSSWFAYADMDRIFKSYHFEYRIPSATKGQSFSSYPGYLESLDDFYMMDSGLGMVQTSNNILNEKLLDLVKPQSLLAWQRVRVANAMAKTGQQWYEAFRQHASGTYVNQYMVVDFNLFQPRTALRDGTLWVVEEIPGLVMGKDQTAILRLGYWPSYNVPFYPEVYTLSGYTDERLGPYGSYELAPRAKIFRRDQASVVDMTSFKRIMRYANYSDPYAKTEDGKVDYAAAICMRGDLANGGAGTPMGCYDTKVTSHLHGFWQRSAEIVNGPSSVASDGTQQKSGNAPFKWRPADAKVTHVGLPPSFSFDFMPVQPRVLEQPMPSVDTLVI